MSQCHIVVQPSPQSMSEHFLCLKKKPSLPLNSPSPSFIFCFYGFACSFHTWAFVSDSFTEMAARCIHMVACDSVSFLFMAEQYSMSGHSTFCFSAQHWMDIWVVSTRWLLQIMFWGLWGTGLGVGCCVTWSRGHMGQELPSCFPFPTAANAPPHAPASTMGLG